MDRQGAAHGILIDIAKQVLDRAGVDYVFAPTPLLRIMDYVKRDTPHVLVLGFAKSAERDAMGRFSKPIYKTPRAVLLVAGKNKAMFEQLGTMENLVTQSGLVFGGVMGSLYPISPYLARMGSRDTRYSVSPSNLVAMLEAGRFDFMTAFPEEAQYLLQRQAGSADEIAYIRYPDLPDGPLLYFYYAPSLDSTVATRLNNAIKELKLPR